MELTNDSLPILAGIINNTGKAMCETMKYLYLVSENDFYDVNVKDIFRMALIDVTDASRIANLGIKSEKALQQTEIFKSQEFARVQHLIAYSLAVRIPFYKKQFEDLPMKDRQLRQLYEITLNGGADNYGEVIFESFDENTKLVRAKPTVPAFTSEWFRRYVYNYIPELGEINNRNLFFLGCVEAMFPLYYSALITQLKKVFALLLQ